MSCGQQALPLYRTLEEEEVSRHASWLLPSQLFGNKQLHRPSSKTSGASGFGGTEVSDTNACTHLCGSLKKLC